MKGLRLFGVPLRVRPLMPLTLLLAWQTGLGREALAMLPALFLHEAAHLLAARLCGLRVLEMELTPVGAALRLQSPWSAGALRTLGTALAGPGANLALVCVLGALAYAGWLPAHAAALLIRPNLLLAAVNLLPALPLDGGRALCALLACRTGAARAVRMGALGGYILGGSLAGAALALAVARGVWNVSVLVAAAYICACAARESAAAVGANAEALLLRRDDLARRGSLPVRALAVPESLALAKALSLLRPGKVHIFFLCDDAMRLRGWLSEEQLLGGLPALSARPLAELLPAQPPQSRAR